MNKAAAYIIVLVLAGLFSCRNKDRACMEPAMVVPCKEDPAMTNIRIRNVSDYNFCSVMMNPGSYTAYYGPVKKNELTCYQPFSQAYATPSITLFINEKKFILQVIDYVDAIALDKGKYTVSIDVTDFDKGELQLQTTPD